VNSEDILRDGTSRRNSNNTMINYKEIAILATLLPLKYFTSK